MRKRVYLAGAATLALLALPGLTAGAGAPTTAAHLDFEREVEQTLGAKGSMQDDALVPDLPRSGLTVTVAGAKVPAGTDGECDRQHLAGRLDDAPLNAGTPYTPTAPLRRQDAA